MSVAPILHRALLLGGLLALGVGVVGAIVGWSRAGWPGVAAALVGAATAAVFLGLTAVSILVAARVTAKDPGSPRFFGIVVGALVLKFPVFIVLAIWLRGQPWLDPMTFFGTVVVATMGSLVVDAVAFQTTRVPYVSDPGGPPASGGATGE